MNILPQKYRSRWIPLAPAILLGLISANPLLGQTPATRSGSDLDADIVELSVFEVSASADIGYAATSTLAGSRVRTDLADLPAPVTVFTEALMGDLAASNIQEMIGYAANVETFSESADAGNPTGDADLIEPNRTRVRGLDAATITRNYFATNIRLDAYNTTRLDVSRGPNSILFGLGSPAGVINSTLKRAVFRNVIKLEGEFDSEGSHRGVLSVNRELIKDKLAINLSGVHEQQEFWQKPTLDHQNRGFFAVQARPFAQTLINASYENYWNFRRLARSTQVRDGVSPWIAAGRPTWRPGMPVDPTIFTQNNTAVVPIYVNGGSLGEVPQFYSRAREVYTIGPGSLASGADSYDYSISTDIFPASINFTGYASSAELEGEIANVSIEQKIGSNLSLEFAYNWEHSKTGLVDLIGFGGSASVITADPNELLSNGQPNPNVGRYYVEVNPRAVFNDVDTEALRLTASYDLDFSETSAKWLGRHRISGLASSEDVEIKNDAAREFITSSHAWLPAAARTNLANNGRRVVRRFYLDDPYNPVGGESYAVPDYVVLNGEVDGVVSDPSMPGAVGANSHAVTETTSLVGVLQSYFWNNKIIGTFGWRRDEQSVYQGSIYRGDDNLWITSDQIQLPSDATSKTVANTGTRGVAVHPLPWLSLYYNEADNFSLAGANIDVYNRPLPGASGEGQDIGIGLRLPNNKFSIRATKFEVSQKGSPASIFRTYFRGNISNIEDAVAEYSGEPRDPNAGASDLWPIFDQTAEGYEFEAVLNPTPNWRILANVAQQKTIQTNIAPMIREYVTQRLPAWQPYFDQPLLTNNRTIEDIYQSFIKYGLDLAEASDGFQSPRQSEWRFNLVNTYTFAQDSVLGGWSIGGALRWAQAPVIGYQNKTTSSGELAPDVSKPYFGDDSLNVDGWLRYRFVLASKRVIQIQLNVKNLFDRDDLIPQRKRSDGMITNFQAPNPRLFVLNVSTTF